MEIVAFPAIGTATACVEETTISDASLVGTGEAAVFLDVTPRLRLYFAGTWLVPSTADLRGHSL